MNEPRLVKSYFQETFSRLERVVMKHQQLVFGKISLLKTQPIYGRKMPFCDSADVQKLLTPLGGLYVYGCIKPQEHKSIDKRSVKRHQALNNRHIIITISLH